MNKFYITTSIAYTNSNPHIGFALELIQADAIARYQRLLGKDVFFLTGTDEHGQKNVKAAESSGKDPKEFCDDISLKYRELTKALNISNNDFIRTSDQQRHWPTVEKVWLKLKENNDLYKKKYQGLYCSGCEAFITKKDLINGKCAVHQEKPELVEEENYFFRLSKYSKAIEQAIEKHELKIIPETRKNEVLSFIRQGLEDVSFSRPRKDLKWGVPVPNDPEQTIYVWVDALSNYISGLGGKDKFWPADIHCIGKDIIRFHAIYWPAILLSIGFALPRSIFVHGFITVDNQKMSKSLGNIIDPFELVRKYGADSVRYFLLRELSPTEDGDFSIKKFEARYQGDLAKGVGNLVARVIGFSKDASKPEQFNNKKFKDFVDKTEKQWKQSMDILRFNDALSAVWGLIGFCDKYIEEKKPWESKEKAILEDLLLAIEKIAWLLSPFIPQASSLILKETEEKKGITLFPQL